jgi:RNA polymerase sigma-70 factor, ECF subfamily
VAEGTLRAAFLAAVDPVAHPVFEADEDLEARLDRSWVAARATMGELGAGPTPYVQHLARAVAGATASDALDQLRAADLYLACACSLGDTRALERFDHEFGRDIDLAIARSGSLNVAKDEFRQLLRDKLFVSRGDRLPKIADYAGRGDLRSWVRVTAVRMIVDIARQRTAGKEIPVESDLLGAMPSPAEDPELDYIQRVYKNEFRDALQLGFSRLTPRERNLLRHQVIHGLNIDQVGAIYHVHRTTAFRWIEKARKALLKETRELLMSRLAVGATELLSIMRVVQGDLDVSVRRLLVSDIEQESDDSR